MSTALNSGAQYASFVYNGPVASGVQIDEKIVLKQKEKALKELDSRVKLATSQHNKMYELQRSHVISEHDRQLDIVRKNIEDERASNLSALEIALQDNLRALEHNALAQRISIEQQANILEIKSVQHLMQMQTAERERQWSATYSGHIYTSSSAQQFFPPIQIPSVNSPAPTKDAASAMHQHYQYQQHLIPPATRAEH
jgi:hypothetical protein